MFLRIIQRWPILGLLFALSIEAWIPVPGEALIAAAASRALRNAAGLLRVALIALAGMMANDLVLYGISRMARGLALHFIHHNLLRVHLNVTEMLVAKFLPPVRSTAFVLYGFQGTGLHQFVLTSLLTSVVWIGLYALLGNQFRASFSRLFHMVEGRHGRWITAVEIVLTVASIALIFQPFS